MKEEFLFHNDFILFLPEIQIQRRHRQIDRGFTGSVMDIIAMVIFTGLMFMHVCLCVCMYLYFCLPACLSELLYM